MVFLAHFHFSGSEINEKLLLGITIWHLVSLGPDTSALELQELLGVGDEDKSLWARQGRATLSY